MNGENHEAVERVAYQLWEERGRPIGSPEVDWIRAEQALRSEASSQELPFSALAMEPVEE